MAKVVCALCDDPIDGYPKSYVRDDLPMRRAMRFQSRVRVDARKQAAPGRGRATRDYLNRKGAAMMRAFQAALLAGAGNTQGMSLEHR
jgi:hypothetical protein